MPHSTSVFRNNSLLRQRNAQNLAKLWFSTSLSAGNNADDIEKVKHLLEVKMAEIKEAEIKQKLEDQKPKISDFKKPIFHVLLVGSLAYLSFHWAWWYLEYFEREKELKAQLAIKQEELDNINPDSLKNSSSNKSWFRFWR